MLVKRGDIYYADLSPVVGSEQGGVRPVLVIQNDVGNKFSPTIIVALMTSKDDKTFLPTHVRVRKQGLLTKDSHILTEQIRTVDKRRVQNKVLTLDDEQMKLVDKALIISLGL